MLKLYLIVQGSHLKYSVLKYQLFNKGNISGRKDNMSRLTTKVHDGGAEEERVLASVCTSVKVRLYETNYFSILSMEVPTGANLHLE